MSDKTIKMWYGDTDPVATADQDSSFFPCSNGVFSLRIVLIEIERQFTFTSNIQLNCLKLISIQKARNVKYFFLLFTRPPLAIGHQKNIQQFIGFSIHLIHTVQKQNF